MTYDSAIRQRFRAAVGVDDSSVNLAQAALLIAAEAYEDLDVDGYLGRLDALAADARRQIDGASESERITAVIEFLAQQEGFRGNQDDYYDRRNSYFNEVIDRRTGIPITLALVYVEIGRRVGLDIQGVGFPGHFLAIHNGTERTIIDPFFGTTLDEAACSERLQSIMGPEAQFDESLLDVASPRQILVRMLSNLKLIHLREREFEQALACSERVLIVDPDLPTELRDRAALYLQLECFDAARTDLERFLEIAPEHESAALVHAELVKLRSSGPVLH